MPINTDQCRSKFWYWSQCRSIPINADQFRSIPINWLRGHIPVIGIERHFGSMPWFWSALIDIDRHWAMIKGVLIILLIANSVTILNSSAVTNILAGTVVWVTDSLTELNVHNIDIREVCNLKIYVDTYKIFFVLLVWSARQIWQ